MDDVLSEQQILNPRLTGVILTAENSSQMTLHKVKAISIEHFPWTTVICHFHNVSDLPSTPWRLWECCDACILAEGSIEVNQANVIFEQKTHHDQVLVFSVGATGMACGQCGFLEPTADAGEFRKTLTVFNRTLLAVGLNKPPYIQVDFDRPTLGRDMGGFEYLMMRDISRFLGFRYEVTTIPGVVPWGMKVNGTYVGLLKMLVERRAHFAVGDVTLFSPRNVFLDHTFPHDFDVLTSVSRVNVKKFASRTLLRALDSCSWVAILCLTLATCLVLAAASQLTAHRKSAWAVFLTGFEYIYTAVVQPSSAKLLIAEVPLRGLLGLWSVCLFLLYSLVSGRLVTLITTPNLDGIVNTHQQWYALLKKRPDSRICLSESHLFNLLRSQSRNSMSDFSVAIEPRVYEPCLHWSGDRITEEIVLGQNGFWIEEAARIREHFNRAAKSRSGNRAMAHIAPGLSIANQAIFLQKACAFTESMGRASRLILETGHLIHYKKQLDVYSMPVVILERDVKPVKIDSLDSIFYNLFVILFGLIAVLLAECCASTLARQRDVAKSRTRRMTLTVVTRPGNVRGWKVNQGSRRYALTNVE